MNPDEKAAEARLRAVAASHWRDVDAVDHNDALRVGDIRIMLALLDEARADYTAERERANEWLAQLHDASAEVARLRAALEAK